MALLATNKMDMRVEPITDSERAIARVIAHRYGDGGVYIPRQERRPVALELAIADGFVSQDGFITRKGRRLLARIDI